MFPETYGRTLEELAFLFEDRTFAEEATMKVEKQIHTELDEWRTSYQPPGLGAGTTTTHITAMQGARQQERVRDYHERWT
jgi:hypothetical protein